MLTDSTMATRILDVAQFLVQTRGYHAFSYADIASEVGIRKASIHHYFPGKVDLARALVSRYRQDMQQRTCRIDLLADGSSEKLRGYAQIYRDTARNGGRLCLCGVLATDLGSAPPSVQAEVRQFYAENESWLARVLEEGRSANELSFAGPAWIQAQGLLTGLQGALVAARVHDSPLRYCAIAHQMLAGLGLDIAEREITDPE